MKMWEVVIYQESPKEESSTWDGKHLQITALWRCRPISHQNDAENDTKTIPK